MQRLPKGQRKVLKSMRSLPEVLRYLAFVSVQDAVDLAARGKAGANPVVEYMRSHPKFEEAVELHQSNINSGVSRAGWGRWRA